MTGTPPPTTDAAERFRRTLPGRTLPPDFYADFVQLDDTAMRSLIDASIMSAAERLNRIFKDDTLDDHAAMERMTDEIMGLLRLVARGNMAFAADGIGRIYRVDSPAPTPAEEAAIERRLTAARPLVSLAITQHLEPQ